MSTINTNIPSLVAARVLNTQNGRLSTSLERLSTGFRINTGKDDPAGLIASEVMRSEKAGINAAIDNALSADKLVSVAEGALNEVNSLLLELEALVDKSANTAALSTDEIRANQLQVDSILESIDRIANTTSFKGNRLLNGTLDYTTTGVTSALGAVSVTGAKLAGGTTRTVSVVVTSGAETGRLNFDAGATSLAGNRTIRISGEFGSDTISLVSGTSLTNVAAAINQSQGLTGVRASASGNEISFLSSEYGSSAFVTVEAVSGTFDTTNALGQTVATDYGIDATATINGIQATTDGLNASVKSSTLKADLVLSESLGTAVTSTTSFTITGGGANFSLSPTIGLSGLEGIGVKSVAAASLGNSSIGFLSSLRSGDTNDLDSDNLATSQQILRQASRDISTLRGRLGAFQKNTLQPTINSLQITLENTSAAESAIRDTDYAAQTSELTRAQILVNAAVTTLQLANQQPATVLSLLG